MQQVAVRAVDFDDPESRRDGSPCGRGKGRLDFVNPRAIERDGQGIGFVERKRAGRDYLPSAIFDAEAAASMKRWNAARLAPGVGKLNGRNRAHALNEFRNAGQEFDVPIVINSHIAGSDAALRGNAGCFDKTSPAPPTARLPRWTRCQSSANPSTEEYWHMGETTIRLRA